MVKNSSVWDQKLREGELRGVKKTIFIQAKDRFGQPSDEVRTRLMNIDDDERLDRMALAVIRVANWDEVLATP